jgi:hypothetical protein
MQVACNGEVDRTHICSQIDTGKTRMVLSEAFLPSTLLGIADSPLSTLHFFVDHVTNLARP